MSNNDRKKRGSGSRQEGNIQSLHSSISCSVDGEAASVAPGGVPVNLAQAIFLPDGFLEKAQAGRKHHL
jgi:hypothetical protein